MKRRILTAAAGLAGLALLWGAGAMHSRLLDARRQYHLGHAEPLENAPPLVVFSTVALGGFSGVISDILWVRAAQLQMDGQYFELVQLADWITKLQPRFPEGWVYHAWNLSYNVTVMFQRAEDRWRWVRHGVELLRDGGLRYNPANPTLHRELAWLFQHKIGDSIDPAHRHYKLAWAREMERLFDGRGPDYDQLERTPASRDALLRIAGIPELVEQLQAAGFEPFTYQWPEPARLDAMRTLLREHPAGHVLLRHIRLRMLVDRYRLLPARMREIEAEYGPLDWRLPPAHAIYWAWNGLPHADGFEARMLERILFHSHSKAFQEGRFIYNADEDLFMPGPNPDILPQVMRAYDEAMERHPDDAMQTAHINFLNHALTVLYGYNRIPEARTVFKQIQTRYPLEVAEQNFEPYVIQLFTDQSQPLQLHTALPFIERWFHESYFWLALDETEQATGYERLARRAWELHVAPRVRELDLRERTTLPSLDELQSRALQRVRETLTSPAAHERLSSPDER